MEIPEDTTHRLEPVRLPKCKDPNDPPRWRQKVPMETLIKIAMVKKYATGKGGCYTAALQKKKSRRDEIREWQQAHPDAEVVNLRTKVGQPENYPKINSSRKTGAKFRTQVPAKRKKEENG